MLRIGERLDERFEIVSVLGATPFGEVYRAGDLARGLQVSITVLRPLLAAGSSAAVALHRREAILLQLEHPSIVRVIEIVDTKVGAVIVSEPRGLPLREFLTRSGELGRLPVGRAREFGAALCDALDYAHRQIVHGAITLDTIWVEPDGRPKLGELGLANIFDQIGAPLTLAQSRDEAGDVCGLAMVLSEILAGDLAPRQSLIMQRSDLPADLATLLDRLARGDVRGPKTDLQQLRRATSAWSLPSFGAKPRTTIEGMPAPRLGSVIGAPVLALAGVGVIGIAIAVGLRFAIGSSRLRSTTVSAEEVLAAGIPAPDTHKELAPIASADQPAAQAAGPVFAPVEAKVESPPNSAPVPRQDYGPPEAQTNLRTASIDARSAALRVWQELERAARQGSGFTLTEKAELWRLLTESQKNFEEGRFGQARDFWVEAHQLGQSIISRGHAPSHRDQRKKEE